MSPDQCNSPTLCWAGNYHSGDATSDPPAKCVPRLSITYSIHMDTSRNIQRPRSGCGHWEWLPVERLVCDSMIYWAVHWIGAVYYVPVTMCNPLSCAGLRWPYPQQPSAGNGTTLQGRNKRLPSSGQPSKSCCRKPLSRRAAIPDGPTPRMRPLHIACSVKMKRIEKLGHGGFPLGGWV